MDLMDGWSVDRAWPLMVGWMEGSLAWNFIVVVGTWLDLIGAVVVVNMVLGRHGWNEGMSWKEVN